MITLQADYYQKLCSKYPWPISALKIFSKKIYIITSPELAQSVFRNAKTLSFDPITTSVSKRVFQMTKRQVDLLQATYRVMHATMQPGRSLFQTNAVALTRFASFLDEVDAVGETVDLYDWLQHRFTIATAEALYGASNPISQNSAMIQSLVDFEKSIALLFLNILPSVTCPSGNRARAAFREAFKHYYRNNDLGDASALIRGRHDVLTSNGFTTDDVACFDIGVLMAATINSNPGIFWLVSFIYSSPSLLSSIRKEVEEITSISNSQAGNNEARMDISLLLQSCPLLVSAWQETLRIRAATIPNRVVTADTVLNDTYTLKEGSIIQLHCQTMHTSPSIWGPDAARFDATRFLTSSTAAGIDKETRKKRKQALSPFGGGSALCPGRYFSSMEIVGVVATLVAAFDIEGVRVLEVKMQAMSEQVKHPEGDLQVKIKRRKGWEDVKWKFVVGAGVEGAASMFE
ncbi:uncharacterized protein L3040_002103 [Drepanopeziza brunnea f. sp. 'multigermtubi']|nr:hypothetical protein L3040_002103 [Drepanopeziza brunnea f. sp. 'multigermtubi']